jgi:hypothetical protein
MEEMYSSTSADYANDSANRALDRVGMLELRVSSLEQAVRILASYLKRQQGGYAMATMSNVITDATAAAALLISRTERGVQAAEQAVDRIEAGNV